MLFLCIIIMFFLKKKFFDSVDYKTLLIEGAIIVDVRSLSEFSVGNIDNSLNIPVGELMDNLDLLKNKDQTIITCCASGIRSGAAKQILITNGYSNVINGGGWSSLNNKINK